MQPSSAFALRSTSATRGPGRHDRTQGCRTLLRFQASRHQAAGDRRGALWVIALNLDADCCPECKELKPKLQKATKDAARQPYLIVTLAQTDEESRQAEYMLATVGIPDLRKQHAGKTHLVMLVDDKPHRIINTTTPEQSTKHINAAFKAVLKG